MVSVVPRKKSDFAPGEHPHSQGNLQPRETMYGEAKKRREVMVTPTGWDGFKALAASMDLSASELVERLGRGAIAVANVSEHPPAIEAAPTRISELGLSLRVVDLLQRAGFEALEDLQLLSPDDLREIRGLGPAAQQEVIEKCGQWLRKPN